MGGDVLNADSTVILIKLEDFDLHEMKGNLQLATRINNTYINLFQAAVSDLSLNVNEIESTTMCAAEYTEDKVDPHLLEFTVDIIDDGILVLSFDEPIDTTLHC